MSPPKVSAVIVNWNGVHHLRICLPSLLAQTFRSLEIIVVDNGSTDNSELVVRDAGARWVPMGRNLGLAPALNRGAKMAAGEMLLFVNNDMRFDAEFVSNLLKPIERNSAIFATDAMQFNWDGSVRAHLAARLLKTKPQGRDSAELVPGLHFYQQQEDQEARVFMGSAACMLVRRQPFEKLDGFDDRLPLGYEDTDLCWRAWLRGLQTVFVPGAICWHHVGGSSGTLEAKRLNFRGVLTGRLLFATKLLPISYAVRTWLVSIAGIVKDLFRFQFRLAGDRAGILAQMAKLAPKLFRERRAIFEDADSSPERHLRQMLQLTDNAPLS